MGRKITELSIRFRFIRFILKIEEMKRLGSHPALLLYTAGISNVWLLCGDKSACHRGRALRDRYHGWEKSILKHIV